MAYFYALRGWLALDHKGFDRAITPLSRLRQEETDEKHLSHICKAGAGTNSRLTDSDICSMAQISLKRV